MIEKSYKTTQVLDRKLWIWQSYKDEISIEKDNYQGGCSDFFSLPDNLLKNNCFSRECLDPIKELYDVCQYPEDPQTDFLYASLVFLTFVNSDEVVDYYFSIYPKLRALEEETDYFSLFILIVDAYTLGKVPEECVARKTLYTSKGSREGKKMRVKPTRDVTVNFCYKTPDRVTKKYVFSDFYSLKDLFLQDVLEDFDCPNPSKELVESAKPDRYCDEEYLLADFLYAALVVWSFQEDYLLDYFLDLFPWVQNYTPEELYKIFVSFYNQKSGILDKKYWPRELNIEMTV